MDVDWKWTTNHSLGKTVWEKKIWNCGKIIYHHRSRSFLSYPLIRLLKDSQGKANWSYRCLWCKQSVENTQSSSIQLIILLFHGCIKTYGHLKAIIWNFYFFLQRVLWILEGIWSCHLKLSAMSPVKTVLIKAKFRHSVMFKMNSASQIKFISGFSINTCLS